MKAPALEWVFLRCPRCLIGWHVRADVSEGAFECRCGQSVKGVSLGRALALALAGVRGPGTCRLCGCTDEKPCQRAGVIPTCSWVEPDLCSVCYFAREFRSRTSSPSVLGDLSFVDGLLVSRP
jgi:hypothetical protein